MQLNQLGDLQSSAVRRRRLSVGFTPQASNIAGRVWPGVYFCLCKANRMSVGTTHMVHCGGLSTEDVARSSCVRCRHSGDSCDPRTHTQLIVTRVLGICEVYGVCALSAGCSGVWDSVVAACLSVSAPLHRILSSFICMNRMYKTEDSSSHLDARNNVSAVSEGYCCGCFPACRGCAQLLVSQSIFIQCCITHGAWWSHPSTRMDAGVAGECGCNTPKTMRNLSLSICNSYCS